MPRNLGDFHAGATTDFTFTTISTAQVPTTLAGTPVITIYAGNSTTPITAGITLSVDFAGKTGLNHVRIVMSDAAYTTGTDFHVVITTGTVGGTSVVGYTLATFSIQSRFGVVHSLLKLDWTGLTGEAARSCLNAFRFLRNLWSVSGTTLTVKKEDDSTTAWTGTVTVVADPSGVTGVDPA